MTEPQTPAGSRAPIAPAIWTLTFILAVLGPISAVLVSLTGLALFWWFGVAFAFGILPLLDVLMGTDAENRLPAPSPRRRIYRWMTVAFVPTALVSFFWAAWIVGSHDWSLLSFVGFAITSGVSGSAAINAAHELGHKRPKLERTASRVALASVAYSHFFVEHNRGHHRHVSTPLDPASARFGESLYRFLPRTLFGSARSAWGLEKRRMELTGKAVFGPSNQILSGIAMTVVIWIAASALSDFSILIGAFLVIQAATAISMLETVNYLEHYGLVRELRRDGKYEPCQPHHSWNSDHRISNMFLFQLQRHSDHHANPTRPFEQLRHFDHSPQLPAGYAPMMLAAAVPALWYRLMNDRVLTFVEHDMGRIHTKDSPVPAGD